MGTRMAKNLLKNSSTKHMVFDSSPQAVKKFVELNPKENFTVAQSPADIAKNCSVIFTMLPSGKAVDAVYNGRNGTVSTGLQENATVIDCSTIDKNDWLSISKDIKKKTKSNVKTFDAPVSGGVLGAQDGTLTFMVGAENAEDVSSISPILKTMGTNVFHCGPSGAGQVAKVCNNLILGITMAAVSEAMILGMNEGLNPTQLNEIFTKCTGQSWVTNKYNPVPNVHPNAPASKGYEGGFATSLVIKDLTLAEKLAESQSQHLPMTKLANILYNNTLMNNGNNELYSEKDFSSIYKFLKKKQGSNIFSEEIYL